MGVLLALLITLLCILAVIILPVAYLILSGLLARTNHQSILEFDLSAEEGEGRDQPLRALNLSLINLLEKQIAEGRQGAVQISAFYKGKQVINVFGGEFVANGRTKRVTKDTLFMSYSVAKGVAATTLATLIDKTEIKYSDKVSKIWPEFAQNGKDNVTIEQAISHRGGMTKAPPVTEIISTYRSDGARGLWKLGMNWIAGYTPEWEAGKKASYHAVSWSWIIGGIIQKISGSHVADLTQQNVAEPLGMKGKMFIGELPTQYHDQVCPWEFFPNFPRLFKNSKTEQTDSLGKKLICMLESSLLTRIGNSATWKDICLPSSNGFFTATAVSKMYADIIAGSPEDTRSNSGSGGKNKQEENGSIKSSKLLSREIQNQIFQIGKENLIEGKYRLGLGWVIDPHTELYGTNYKDCLGHEGIGGCTGFADPNTGLAICVMTNVYTPYYMNKTSVSQEDLEIVQHIRDTVLGGASAEF